MKRLILAIVILLLVAVFGIAAADVELNGFVENQERVRTARIEGAPEEYPADFMMADTWLDLAIRGTGYDERAKMFANADLRWFALDHDEAVELRLREAWAGFYLDFMTIEVGKKVRIWGMADEMNPTDLICAEDLRWFFTYDKPERKIGDWSASLAFSFHNFKVEGVWLPIFQQTILPEMGSDWVPWKLQTFYNIVEQYPDFIEYKQQQFPDTKIANSAGAFRFGGTVGPVDFELTAYDGYDHLPTFDVLIDASVENIVLGNKPLILREEYQRFNAFGGSLTGAVDAFTFRAEGAYYSPRYYMHTLDPGLLNPGNLVTALNLLRQMEGDEFRSQKPSFQVVGGVDYRVGNWFYGNIQYFHIQILEYEDILMDDRIDNGLSGTVEFAFLDETLKLAAKGAYNFSQEDWYAQPYISYLLTDALSVEGGLTLFGGDYQTNFGEFDDNDYAYTKMRFSF